jgi:hypothetical protein
MNTNDEPMYYSLIDSVGGYKLDLPDGKYAVTLYFAEPSRLKTGIVFLVWTSMVTK